MYCGIPYYLQGVHERIVENIINYKIIYILKVVKKVSIGIKFYWSG